MTINKNSKNVFKNLLNPDLLNESYQIIEKSYSRQDAQICSSFNPDQLAIEKIVEIAKHVLVLFPPKPGACALMTALWVSFLRSETNFPVHALVGSLFIDDECIYGPKISDQQNQPMFDNSNLDWDGHCWLLLGNFIGDISIFRTAYSKYSPPKLRDKIQSTFGPNKGILLCPVDQCMDMGITYKPLYSLKDCEIEKLVMGASLFVESNLRDKKKR